MNTQTVPPPPRAGTGCLGIGCLAFIGFFLFLAVAFVGGAFWALHHVRQNYSSTEPLVLPEFSENSVALPAPSPTPALPNGNAAPLPALPVPVEPVERRWKAFEKAARRHEKARIELSANEINALLAGSRNTRGKAFVTVANGVGHVQVSIPLKNIIFMGGRYLNGEASVRSAADGDPTRAEIFDLKIGDQSVPAEFLDRRLFGWSTIRSMIGQWLDDNDVAVFRIEGERVIGETRG